MRHLSAQPSNLISLQDECLKLLTGVFDIPKAAAYMVDRRSNMFCIKNYYVQPGMQREYFDRFYQYDPLHPHNLTDKHSAVLRTNDIITLNDRIKHPYYREFLSRWGIHDTVEIYLRSEERIVAGFSLFLDEGEKNPANMDIKKLEQLHSFMQFSLEACLNTPQQRSFETTCDEYQLTGKERMVVEQVLQGLPNKSIATNLCCSLPTIKTHLQNIFEKINVNSKAELTSLLYMQRN